MILLALLLAAPTATERAAAARVTAAELSAHIRFISDDVTEGRKPGSPGDEIAMKYIAAELEEMGLKPAGDNGTYFQSVPLIELHADVPRDITFRAGAKSLTLHTGGGVAADLRLDPDALVDRAQFTDAPLVFAGYGIVAPEYGWDDYKDADVRGKIVVLMNFNPPFAGEGVRLWYGRWDYKYLTAAAHGALGALIIHTTASAGYPWQVLANASDGTRQDLPPAPDEKRMQFQGWITDEAAHKLAQLSEQDLDKLREAAQRKDFRPQPIGSTLSLDMPVKRRTIQSANVIGVLPGSDPKLRDEAVIYTAHHDHLGKVPPVPPATDGIYNGALDNASGCAVVLTIARAATFAQPKRSLYFALVTAEEQGLLGSKFLALHPPVPAGRIAANINVDSPNKWGRAADLGVFGLGKSSLDAVVKTVAAEQGRSVHGDPFPDRGTFYRSDQFPFARVGVPVLYARGGPTFVGRPPEWGETQMRAYEMHDYHQPSDEYRGDWDLSGMVQDAQLELIVGLRVADAPQMPRWTPGDEFEKARKSAAR
jgi:Zn-dependent M28 family amino/carboxypeptidase